jgi:Flp pilus assembly pilin Flp
MLTLIQLLSVAAIQGIGTQVKQIFTQTNSVISSS